ncbi:hypothetical protein ACLB2K_073621 [Fragaria x ananassa]
MIYDTSEISSSTNNFLSHRLSSSSTSTSWRCTLRGKDAVVFQRKSRTPIDLPDLQQSLSLISRSHHTSLIKLLGASLSGSYVYLVYEFVDGANLADCLRNPNNPSFTVLSSSRSNPNDTSEISSSTNNFLSHRLSSSSTSTSRRDVRNLGATRVLRAERHTPMVVVDDVAILVDVPRQHEESQGFALDMVGVKGVRWKAALVVLKDRLVYASLMVVAAVASMRAMQREPKGVPCIAKHMVVESVAYFKVVPRVLKEARHCARDMVEESVAFSMGVGFGQRVYMVALISVLLMVVERGEEGGYKRMSLIEKAREAVKCGGGVRRWVDRRLKDSFPMEVAEKMVQVALECVEDGWRKSHLYPQFPTHMTRTFLSMTEL